MKIWILMILWGLVAAVQAQSLAEIKQILSSHKFGENYIQEIEVNLKWESEPVDPAPGVRIESVKINYIEITKTGILAGFSRGDVIGLYRLTFVPRLPELDFIEAGQLLFEADLRRVLGVPYRVAENRITWCYFGWDEESDLSVLIIRGVVDDESKVTHLEQARGKILK